MQFLLTCRKAVSKLETGLWVLSLVHDGKPQDELLPIKIKQLSVLLSTRKNYLLISQLILNSGRVFWIVSFRRKLGARMKAMMRMQLHNLPAKIGWSDALDKVWKWSGLTGIWDWRSILCFVQGSQDASHFVLELSPGAPAHQGDALPLPCEFNCSRFYFIFHDFWNQIWNTWYKVQRKCLKLIKPVHNSLSSSILRTSKYTGWLTLILQK